MKKSDERLQELEIKITFLDDYVSKQNEMILVLSRDLERLNRMVKTLTEKTDTLEASGNIPPANEKPPHW